MPLASFAGLAIGAYSRLAADAKNSPFGFNKRFRLQCYTGARVEME